VKFLRRNAQSAVNFGTFEPDGKEKSVSDKSGNQECNMRKLSLFLVIALSCLLALRAVALQMQPSAEDEKQDGPAYTGSGDLKMPDYRRWIFLTSGIDMNYQPIKSPPGHSIFQNVFVNPRSYEEFLKTGTWPDMCSFSDFGTNG
jgi:hypothetical protein